MATDYNSQASLSCLSPGLSLSLPLAQSVGSQAEVPGLRGLGLNLEPPLCCHFSLK